MRRYIFQSVISVTAVKQMRVWIAAAILSGCSVAGNGAMGPQKEECAYCIDQDGDGFGNPDTLITSMTEGRCTEPEELPKGVSEDAVWLFGRHTCTDCDDEADIVFPGNEICSEDPTPLLSDSLTHDYDCNGQHDHCEPMQGMCEVNATETDCDFVPGFLPEALTQEQLNDVEQSPCGYIEGTQSRTGKAVYITGCVPAVNKDGVVTDCTALRESRILSCR